MKRNALPYLSIITAYSIFGFSFLFSKLSLEFVAPSVLLAARFITAFAVINVVLLTGKVKISLKGKPVWKLLLMGIIQPIIYFICESYGIALTSSAFAGIIIGLVPVAGIILGSIFLKENCSVLQIACTVLSVAGVALTTVGGQVKVSALGTVLLLVAVVSNAVFTVISRSTSDVFTPYERTYVMMGLGSVFFTIMAFVQSKGDFAQITNGISQWSFWISILYLAVLSSVCAFMLINYGVSHIKVGAASILANFCTVVSVLAGIFILKEQFSLYQIIGVVIILISVFGISLPKKQKN